MTPSADHALVVEDDSGRGVVVVGTREHDSLPLQAYDLLSGMLLWRRSDYCQLWDLKVGLGHGQQVVRFSAPRGIGCVALRDGRSMRVKDADFQAARRARLPKRWELDFPEPERLPGIVLRRPARGLRGSAAEAAIDEARRKHYFDFSVARRAVGEVERPTLDIKPEVRALVDMLRHLEDQPPLGTVEREPLAPVTDVLGPLPDDILALFAAQSLWLEQQHRISPRGAARFAAQISDVRISPVLTPFGRTTRKGVLCFDTEWLGCRIGSYSPSGYTGPYPLTTWLSTQIWTLAERRSPVIGGPAAVCEAMATARAACLAAGSLS